MGSVVLKGKRRVPSYVYLTQNTPTTLTGSDKIVGGEFTVTQEITLKGIGWGVNNDWTWRLSGATLVGVWKNGTLLGSATLSAVRSNDSTGNIDQPYLLERQPASDEPQYHEFVEPENQFQQIYSTQGGTNPVSSTEHVLRWASFLRAITLRPGNTYIIGALLRVGDKYSLEDTRAFGATTWGSTGSFITLGQGKYLNTSTFQLPTNNFTGDEWAGDFIWVFDDVSEVTRTEPSEPTVTAEARQYTITLPQLWKPNDVASWDLQYATAFDNSSWGEWRDLTSIEGGAEGEESYEHDSVDVSIPLKYYRYRYRYKTLNNKLTDWSEAGYGGRVRNSIEPADDFDSPVGENEIGAGAVNSSHIAANSIAAGHIQAGVITAAEIAAGSITANEIAVGTIVATNIATGTITATNIATGTITANEIAAGTITATEIAAGTITATELTATAIDGMTIIGATIKTASSGARVEMTSAGIKGINASEVQKFYFDTASGILTASAVISAEDGSVIPTDVLAGQITETQIEDDAITTPKLTANAVTAAKINVATLDAIAVNAGTITAGTFRGTTFETAASGARIVMNSTGITKYDSSNNTPLIIGKDDGVEFLFNNPGQSFEDRKITWLDENNPTTKYGYITTAAITSPDYPLMYHYVRGPNEVRHEIAAWSDTDSNSSYMHIIADDDNDGVVRVAAQGSGGSHSRKLVDANGASQFMHAPGLNDYVLMRGQFSVASGTISSGSFVDKDVSVGVDLSFADEWVPFGLVHTTGGGDRINVSYSQHPTLNSYIRFRMANTYTSGSVSGTFYFFLMLKYNGGV